MASHRQPLKKLILTATNPTSETEELDSCLPPFSPTLNVYNDTGRSRLNPLAVLASAARKSLPHWGAGSAAPDMEPRAPQIHDWDYSS
jgi:hypothetical protein